MVSLAYPAGGQFPSSKEYALLKPIAYVSFAALLGLSGCTAGEVSDGLVVLKAVTGVQAGTAYTILRIGAREGPLFVLRSEEYLEYLPPEGDPLLISDALESRLKTDYSEITYLVNIREGDGQSPYTVSRDMFNRLNVGGTARFESSKQNGIPEIKALLESSD